MDAQTEPSTTEAAPSAESQLEAAIGEMAAAITKPTGEPAAEVAAPPADAEPVKEAPLSPQMVALARRDKQLRERETKLKAEFAAREKELADKAAALGSAEELVALYKASPGKFAAKLGLTKEQAQELAKAQWYEAMGDEAPPEVKSTAAMRELEQKLAALEAAREADRKAMEAERAMANVHAARASYRASIDTYIKGELADAPLVKAYAEDTPADVAAQLFELGLRHAESNPEDPIKGPAELVALLNAALEEQVAPLRKRGIMADPKATPKNVPEAKAPSALTNQRASAASKRTTEVASEEERIREALKEFEARASMVP